MRATFADYPKPVTTSQVRSRMILEKLRSDRDEISKSIKEAVEGGVKHAYSTQDPKLDRRMSMLMEANLSGDINRIRATLEICKEWEEYEAQPDFMTTMRERDNKGGTGIGRAIRGYPKINKKWWQFWK